MAIYLFFVRSLQKVEKTFHQHFIGHQPMIKIFKIQACKAGFFYKFVASFCSIQSRGAVFSKCLTNNNHELPKS